MPHSATALLLAISLALLGCSGVERVQAHRLEPASIALPERSLPIGVLPFDGESGRELARVVVEVLGARASLLELDGAERPRSPDRAGALVQQHGVSAILDGWVELVEGPPPTSSDAPDGVPNGPARMRLRYHLILPDGTVRAAPAVSVVLPPVQLARSEDGWRAALVRRAAEEVQRGLEPRSVPIEVTWEEAWGWDEPAFGHFVAGELRDAARLLKQQLVSAQEAGAGPQALGALYYDLGLCQDLLGEVSAAERSYDEAVTLSGTELHLEALRAFRARVERAAKEER